MKINNTTGIWLFRLSLLADCVITAFVPEKGKEISEGFVLLLILSFLFF